MVQGWFRVRATIKNTGTENLDAYVVLRVMEHATGNEYLSDLFYRALLPGQSDAIELPSLARNWASGTHTYRVNLYSRVINRGTQVGVSGNWVLFGYYTLDEEAFLAGKQGTLTI